MNEECCIPPGLRFEQTVLGPFTAREAAILCIFILASIPAFLLSPIAGAACVPLSAICAVMVIADGRRGRHPLQMASAFLSFKLRRSVHARLPSGELTDSHPPTSVFRVEDVNYSCALRDEGEVLLRCLLDICSSPGGIHLVSAPAGPGSNVGIRARSLMQRTGVRVDGSGLRVFYLSTPADRQIGDSLGSAALRKVDSADEGSMQPLLHDMFTAGGLE